MIEDDVEKISFISNIILSYESESIYEKAKNILVNSSQKDLDIIEELYLIYQYLVSNKIDYVFDIGEETLIVFKDNYTIESISIFINLSTEETEEPMLNGISTIEVIQNYIESF